MNNYCTTRQISFYRLQARNNGNACVYYPQSAGALFNVAFYQNARLLKVLIENSFKKPLIIENIDVLTDEMLRILVNAYIKRALKAE